MTDAAMRALIRTYCREAGVARSWITAASVVCAPDGGAPMLYVRGGDETASAFATRVGREVFERAALRRAA